MSSVVARVAPGSVAELMAQAHAFELEAVERYTELADVMETHNNREVAALFRSLAAQEAAHARGLLARMGWTQGPSVPRSPDMPPAPALEQAHYLMHPWHALQIALEAEQQAFAFFGAIAQRCGSDPLGEAAREMQEEEREHVALLQGWLQRVPQPPADWADDPDPPRYHD